ncbi:hypothetical protein L6164_035549 [Bauhinia variegata]|uniref:Uncharacterized protein n=1 Tax=Bauhinia variegata TaxID=167791 RepID=A0ACB9KEA6_BAUVA|nr:hypothetical protein L6164_035549 [Bauhinia variegata]
MAASPLNLKPHSQARSNSLPSEPHPLILQCNEHLSRLEASNATCSSSSLLSLKVTGLHDLHECVENLVQLPHTQQVLVQEHQEKWVDELLDGSLRLLDACTAAKDALLHTKECARELQSIIRRKRGGESEITTAAKKYLTSRKVVKKAVIKALGNLKGVTNKSKFSPRNKDHQTMAMFGLLKDVEVATLLIFESLLKFISGPTQSKASNWSLVSKLMLTKRVVCTQEAEENEFAKVDAALQSFVFHVTIKPDSIHHLQDQLEILESSIQDFVEGLETLFRRFIKTRVGLLNIINH